MWGKKARQIKALERQRDYDARTLKHSAVRLVDVQQQAYALQHRCDSLAADLKAALNDPRCFDCRRGHHDHDIESGTCRRPDCGCKQ